MNGIDWTHVVEEIEDVGLSQLRAVHSYPRQILVHLLKLRGWPGDDASNHWRDEIAAFQAEAADRFTPSMRQKTELDTLHGRAVRQMAARAYGDGPAHPPPASCPVTLDALLTASCPELEAAFLAPDQ